MVTLAEQNALVDQWRGLAISLTRRKVGGPDFDDALCFAYEWLMKAAQNYDPTEGAFSTYATIYIRRGLMAFYQDFRAHVRLPKWRHDNGERPAPCQLACDQPDGVPDPETRDEYDIGLREFVSRAIDGVSRKCLVRARLRKHLLDGIPAREIAAEEGVSCTAIYTTIHNYRPRLQEALKRDWL